MNPRSRNRRTGAALALATVLAMLPAPAASADNIFTSIVWQASGVVSQSKFGSTVACVGDFNGDGYADVAVGAPGLEDTDNWGRVQLYYGSPDGLTGRGLTWFGPHAGSLFGESVAWTGDLDFNGKDEVLVGGPGCNLAGTDAGYARVMRLAGNNRVTAWVLYGAGAGARFGTSVAGVGDVNGDGVGDYVIGSPESGNHAGRIYLYRGGGTPAAGGWWHYTDPQPGARLGAHVAGVGDVDGDGHADLLAAGPDYSGDFADEGEVLVFRGSATGFGDGPIWRITGGRPGARLGEVAVIAGDLDGDGYSDIVVGDPDYVTGAGATGRVLVFRGSPAGPMASPAAILTGGTEGRFGVSVGRLGDVDGDGFDDFAAGAERPLLARTPFDAVYVYRGASAGVGDAADQVIHYQEQPSYFKFSATVAGAGDVNGDGRLDLVIGDPLKDPTLASGEVYIHEGIPGAREIPSHASWTCGGGVTGSRGFGSVVAASGDVNGDGRPDLLMGIPDDGVAGRATLYAGDAEAFASEPVWSVAGQYAGEDLGAAVALCDLDGDGYDDIVVGAPHAPGRVADAGVVQVYRGGPEGPSQTPWWCGRGATRGGGFGAALDDAGDTNGDGYRDLVVGAFGAAVAGTGAGEVTIFFGNPFGLSDSLAWRMEGRAPDTWLGYAVCGVGDIDGDGYADVVAGAPRSDARAQDGGAVVLILGGAAGPHAAASGVETPAVEGLLLGTRVAAAGDVDGDGYGDVLAVAGGLATVRVDAGTVFVYRGGAEGLAADPLWSTGVGDWSSSLGAAVAGLGDIDGDGFDDIAVSDPGAGDGGVVHVIAGSRIGPRNERWTLTGDEAGGRFGAAIALAARGDGYAPGLVVGSPGAGRVSLFRSPRPQRVSVAVQQNQEGQPIPRMAYSGQDAGVRLEVRAAVPPGAAHVAVEWEARAWPDGPVAGGTTRASQVGAAERAARRRDARFVTIPLSGGRDWTWRVRVRSDDPLAPAGPWLSLATGPRREPAVRAGSGPDVAPPPPVVAPPPPPVPFALEPAYPNPFNPSLTVRFTLDRTSRVDLGVYDVAGRRVATLASGQWDGGEHRVGWNGRDRTGRALPSGVYFLRITSEGRQRTRKVVLVR